VLSGRLLQADAGQFRLGDLFGILPVAALSAVAGS
jgi:hypothetical protein